MDYEKKELRSKLRRLRLAWMADKVKASSEMFGSGLGVDAKLSSDDDDDDFDLDEAAFFEMKAHETTTNGEERLPDSLRRILRSSS
jgi:hypothetical protein